MTSVPPSQGENELKGVVVSDYANYAPCPVTPRLMQEIEEQNQIVSWFVRLAPPAILDEKREIRLLTKLPSGRAYIPQASGTQVPPCFFRKS